MNDPNASAETEPATSAAIDDDATISIHRARLINDACERFELAWRDGSGPAIEGFLTGLDGPDRHAMLRELIALDLELRQGLGERPAEGEYLERFPGEAELISAAFCASEPDSIAGYDLLGELGRGGMGVVYRARQRELDRQVALKVLRSGRLASEVEARRFRIEARAAAGLRHPNIVRIFEVGCWHGEHYFSMELIEGGNLSSLAPKLRNCPRAVASLLLKVARAVGHAHELGFVHRDLKPANIMIDGRDDAPLEDREPFVTDFGLVKRIGPGPEEALSRPDGIVGTIEYMAPEQAGAGPIDPRTDVYGLGAVLYALLTGRPPHRGDSPMETLVLVAEKEPEPPGRVRAGVPRDLEAICLRCLEKDPGLRYPTAAAVAEDLGRYLQGEPVEARRTGPVGHVRRWVRREPDLAFRLIGVGLVTLLTQANYLAHAPAMRLPVLHVRVTGVELSWMLLAVLIQAIARRSGRPERLWPAWVAVDVLALTLLLRLLEAADSVLVVGYPMLVAASGLWSRERIVWATAALSALGYAALWLELVLTDGFRPNAYLNIMIASVFVTALLVSHQVRRLKSLARFYQHRPDLR